MARSEGRQQIVFTKESYERCMHEVNLNLNGEDKLQAGYMIEYYYRALDAKDLCLDEIVQKWQFDGYLRYIEIWSWINEVFGYCNFALMLERITFSEYKSIIYNFERGYQEINDNFDKEQHKDCDREQFYDLAFETVKQCKYIV